MSTQSKDAPLTTENRDFVAALASGLDVILAFDRIHPRMTLSEVAAQTGMNRAKARRFLLTLHALGYVRKQDRYFELTPRTLRLGHAFLSAHNYRSVIQHYLEEITRASGESSSMGSLDGNEVVYVARSAAPHRLLAITLSIGSRLPAVATSMGRVLLAQLPEDELDAILARTPLEAYTEHTITDCALLRERLREVHAQGYCILDQELDSGLRSLAMPAYDMNGKLLGAINISTNAARVSMATLTDVLLPLLREKTEQIAAHVL